MSPPTGGPAGSRHGPPLYHAYLLRCWAEGGQGRDRAAAWRFSVEDPHTGVRRGFADLAALIAFLEEMTTPRPGRDGAGRGEE